MIDRPAGGDPARRYESAIGGDARIADLPRWAHAADAAAIALVIVALFVLAQGGFVLHVLGLSLSIKSEWRLFAWAAGLTLVRHLIVRRPPIHRSVASRVAGAARDPGPLIDDIAFFDRKAAPRTTQPATSRSRTAVGIIGVFALYAGLTAWMTYPQVTHMHSVSPDHADPLLSTWRLSWIAYQLPRDPLHLFDANIFYPERHALAFSDSMLVPALTVAPLIWLGVHPLTACNILLLSGFALSGGTMFVLVRSLTRHVGAALFAGFVFAFLPYRFMHYAHLELQMSQWMPLCLWAFHRTMTDGRLRDGLLTGLFLALQMLSSWYYGIFFASFLVPVFAALVMGVRRGQGLRALKPLVAGAVLAVVIVTPFVLPYFAARASVGERPRSEIEFYSAKPQDYLVAHHRNVFFGPLSAGRGSQERELFQGVVVPLIALVGLWPPLSAARIGYALGLVFAFEVSLGFNGLLHPWLQAYVLPYRGLRVPARMGMVVGLALAVLAGYGFARIATRIRGRLAASAAVGAIALAVFLEYRSTLLLDDIWNGPPAAYAAIGPDPSTVVLNLPLIAPDVALEPNYMYFSVFHWHRLVNGYSGFGPPSYMRLLDVMTTFPDDGSLAELRRRDVSFVIVHGAFYRPGAYEQVISRIDARPDFTLVSVVRWERHETRVYRLLNTPSTVSRR